MGNCTIQQKVQAQYPRKADEPLLWEEHSYSCRSHLRQKLCADLLISPRLNEVRGSSQHEGSQF